MPTLAFGAAARAISTATASLRPSSPRRRTGGDSPAARLDVPRSYDEDDIDPLSGSPEAVPVDPATVVARQLPEPYLNATTMRRPLFTSLPADFNTPLSPLFPIFPTRTPTVLCYGNITAASDALTRAGFDPNNRPCGLPLPETQVYIGPELKARVIAEINHTNQLYHLLFGVPFYSAAVVETVNGNPTTEGGDRLSRALDHLSEQFGNNRQQSFSTLLLYCILQQEDPTIFNSWAQRHDVLDSWEQTVESWSGRPGAVQFPPHPLLAGMMVVPTRRFHDHNYPFVRPTSGLDPTQVRPALVFAGSPWRGILGLTDDSLRPLVSASTRRYRMCILNVDGHDGGSASAQYLTLGNNIHHNTGFTLATPAMVEHFWTRLTPMIQLATGNPITANFSAMFEALGLSQEYESQNPTDLWFNRSPSQYRTLWVSQGITVPSRA